MFSRCISAIQDYTYGILLLSPSPQLSPAPCIVKHVHSCPEHSSYLSGNVVFFPHLKRNRYNFSAFYYTFSVGKLFKSVHCLLLHSLQCSGNGFSSCERVSGLSSGWTGSLAAVVQARANGAIVMCVDDGQKCFRQCFCSQTKESADVLSFLEDSFCSCCDQARDALVR